MANDNATANAAGAGVSKGGTLESHSHEQSGLSGYWPAGSIPSPAASVSTTTGATPSNGTSWRVYMTHDTGTAETAPDHTRTAALILV